MQDDRGGKKKSAGIFLKLALLWFETDIKYKHARNKDLFLNLVFSSSWNIFYIYEGFF